MKPNIQNLKKNQLKLLQHLSGAPEKNVSLIFVYLLFLPSLQDPSESDTRSGAPCIVLKIILTIFFKI